jgi:hypothetical protein
MMRREVHDLVALGPFPPEGTAGEERVDRYTVLLEGISPPVSDEEARALVGLFGPDNFYGLAWSVVHLVETAPHWPLEDCLQDTENEWVRSLKVAAKNGRTLPVG